MLLNSNRTSVSFSCTASPDRLATDLLKMMSQVGSSRTSVYQSIISADIHKPRKWCRLALIDPTVKVAHLLQSYLKYDIETIMVRCKNWHLRSAVALFGSSTYVPISSGHWFWNRIQIKFRFWKRKQKGTTQLYNYIKICVSDLCDDPGGRWDRLLWGHQSVVGNFFTDGRGRDRMRGSRGSGRYAH